MSERLIVILRISDDICEDFVPYITNFMKHCKLRTNKWRVLFARGKPFGIRIFSHLNNAAFICVRDSWMFLSWIPAPFGAHQGSREKQNVRDHFTLLVTTQSNVYRQLRHTGTTEISVAIKVLTAVNQSVDSTGDSIVRLANQSWKDNRLSFLLLWSIID